MANAPHEIASGATSPQNSPEPVRAGKIIKTDGRQTVARFYNHFTRPIAVVGNIPVTAEKLVQAIEALEADELRRADAEVERNSQVRNPEIRQTAQP